MTSVQHDNLLSTEVMHDHTVDDLIDISTTYLKLDGSNDPITGAITITPTANSTSTFYVTNKDSANTFIVDTINRRIGINGTPYATLLVNNPTGAGVAMQITTTDGGEQNLFQLDVAGSRRFECYTIPSSSAGMNLRNWLGSTRISMQSQGTTYWNGGFFGIGTESPAGVLHVAAISESLGLGYSATDKPTIIAQAGSSQTANIYEARNSGGTVLTSITSMGGVVIGSNYAGSPPATVTDGSLLMEGALMFAGPNTHYIQNLSASNVIYRIWSGSADLDVLKLTSSGEVIINEGGVATSDFRVEGDTNTHLLFVDASADKVGIGTTAPGYKLDVRGTVQISDEAGNGIVWYRSSVAANCWNTALSGNDLRFFDANGVTGIHLQYGGNVGIGTTGPSYKLDVSGGTGIVGQFSGRVIGGNAVNTNEFVTLGQVGGSAAGWTKSSSNVYLTTSTDSVAIGISSPTARLHLAAGGTAANTAPLKLTTQASGLTSVEQGTFELIGNSLQFTQLLKRRGVMMSQNTRTSTTTVENTTTESSSLLTAEHGANYLEVGKCEILTLIGTLEQRSNVNAKIDFKVKYAGTTIHTISTTKSNPITAGSPFRLTIWTTCRSIGTTGTMQINSLLECVNETAKGGSSLATINTTTAQDTTVTGTWGDANVANILKVEQAFVQCVEPNK